MKRRASWRLVGGIEPGQTGDFAGARLGVELLGIALLAHFQRRVNKNLHEPAGPDPLSRLLSTRAKRRDQRRHHEYLSVQQQPRDLCRPAHVLVAIGFAEPKIGVEAAAQVVAVENAHGEAQVSQTACQCAGQRGLAGGRQAGKPQHARPKRALPGRHQK